MMIYEKALSDAKRIGWFNVRAMFVAAQVEDELDFIDVGISKDEGYYADLFESCCEAVIQAVINDSTGTLSISRAVYLMGQWLVENFDLENPFRSDYQESIEDYLSSNY